ncbi:MAG: hypothetical protein WBO10_11100 [Pyrinomonadaceae bacterium]
MVGSICRGIFVFAILLIPALCFGQDAGPIRSSPAYAEVLLRKTELQADLEAFIESYTETNPKVVDARFELAALDKSLERVFAVKATETGKLTLALGKLLVRRAALETEFARLRRSYNADHPEVMRAKRRVEIFDVAIKDVLN